MLDTFSLAGKVAMVTGCNTGLGQGMALGLAAAGCDIAGVSRRPARETAAKVHALGRRFIAIEADLATAPVQPLVTEAVDALGRLDILVNNAGIIRRDDAIDFSEKDWDEVMDLNLRPCFSFLRPSPDSSSPRAAAGKSLTSPRCSLFRAGFASPLTPLRKAACWA